MTRTTYHAAQLPEIRGEAHGIRVLLQNYPVREADDGSRKKIEAFPDFNVALLDAISKEITDYDHFVAQAGVSPVQFYLKIMDCSPILCKIEVAGTRLTKGKKQFWAELPDALIDAFERAGFRR